MIFCSPEDLVTGKLFQIQKFVFLVTESIFYNHLKLHIYSEKEY